MKDSTNKKTAKKEKKESKSLALPLVIIAGLALVGVFSYKFLYAKIRTRVSNYLVSKSLSKQLGGDVNIEGDGEKVTYKGEDFEFSYDLGGELPDDFPEGFPIYKNAKLMTKWSSSDDEDSGMSVMWETEDSVTSVSDYYKSELVKSGWTITSTFSQEGESSVFSFEKGELEGLLGIAKAEDKVNISVTFSQK